MLAAIERERATCSARAITLSAARKQAAVRLERAIVESLKNLGIASPKFSIAIVSSEIQDTDAFVVLMAKGVCGDGKGDRRGGVLSFHECRGRAEPACQSRLGRGSLWGVMLALKSALAASDKTPVLDIR